MTNQTPEEFFRIFTKQKFLMAKYIEADKLRPYPIDLLIKDDHDFIKKLGSLFIEELCEFLEEYQNTTFAVVNIMGARQDQEGLNESYKKISMELADCLHFLVEMLIFSEILPNHNLTSLLIEANPDSDTYHWHDTQLVGKVIGGLTERDSFRDEVNKIQYGKQLQDQVTILTMKTILKLEKALNCLKIRDWRQADSNIAKYNQCMANVLFDFLVLNEVLGINLPKLEQFYNIKNQINLERLAL